MNNYDNLFQRIGEALTSGGEYNIIRANDDNEIAILNNAGFVQIGSMKDGDTIVSLFKIELKAKEVIKIVEAPTKLSPPWNNSPIDRQPFWDNSPNDRQPYITNTPHIMYSTGTGDTSEWMYKKYNNSVDLTLSTELYKLATLKAPKHNNT